MLAVAGPTDSRPDRADDASVSVSDGAAGRFARLHAAGVTGSNVTVGIVDPTGFDTESKTIAGQKKIGSVHNTHEAHGTATAAVVSRTAPDADLYLARVDSIDSYQQAVDWLVREDIDVIVAPVSFYGQPGDGTGPVARSATQATERGSVFIAPAGNLAQSHWSGQYTTDTVQNRTVAFTNGSRQNYIRGGTEITVWLSWERAYADEEYTVELHWTNGTDSRLVARSQPYRGDDVPNERIVADVKPGDYYLVIRGPASPTGARLRLVSPTHDLQHTAARNSIVAPGTARKVITVGAYNSRVDQLEPFSRVGRQPITGSASTSWLRTGSSPPPHLTASSGLRPQSPTSVAPRPCCWTQTSRCPPTKPSTCWNRLRGTWDGRDSTTRPVTGRSNRSARPGQHRTVLMVKTRFKPATDL